MSDQNKRSPAHKWRFLTLLPACCIALLGLATAPDAAAAPSPTVRIDQGTLTGLENAGVEEFLGVRYAMPPVGSLRWQPPVPVPPGHASVNATQFANNCPQNPAPWGTPSTTEDCLLLNIYAPASARRC
jgi:para-nitrobenzyl esterase